MRKWILACRGGGILSGLVVLALVTSGSAVGVAPSTAQSASLQSVPGHDRNLGPGAGSTETSAATASPISVSKRSCAAKIKKKLKKQLRKKLKAAGDNKKLKKKLRKQYRKKIKKQIKRKCRPGFSLTSDYLGDSPSAPYATPAFSQLYTGPRTVAVRHGDGSFVWYGDRTQNGLSSSVSHGSSETLGDVAVDVQQDPASAAGLAVAYAVSTPPSGLQPETYRVELLAFDAHARRIVSTRLPTAIGNVEDVRLGVVYHGNTIVVSLNADEQEEFLAIDTVTSSLRWRGACAGEDPEVDSDSAGRMLRVCNGNQYSAIDIATGAVLWTKTTVETDIYGLVSAVPGELNTYPGYFVLRRDYGSPALISSADGSEVANGDWRVDYTTGYLAEYFDDTLTIIDLKTRATLLTSDAEVDVVGAFDHRLWIWTSGPDVIDMTTGARDALAPAKKTGYQHTNNVPKLSGHMWVIYSDTNGYGDTEFDLVLYRDTRRPITAERLPRTQIVGLS